MRIYLKDLKSEFKSATDWKYDPWGSAWLVAFAVCAEIYSRHPNAEVLGKWGFSPGAAADPREQEDYFYELLLDAHTGDLIRFGSILNRYLDKLKTAGMDY